MMKETTNTSKFQLTPEGSYTFTVNGVPEKRRSSSGKSTFRIWKLKTKIGESMKVISILLFPWESQDLLLALGGVDEGQGQITWDDEQVDGKSFMADIVHVADNRGELREKLENVQEVAWDD